MPKNFFFFFFVTNIQNYFKLLYRELQKITGQKRLYENTGVQK